MYTSEERLQIAQARRKASQTGKPEVVQRIDAGMASEIPFSKLKALWAPRDVKPEKVVSEVPEHPALNASTAKWQAFAKEVSDMDPEVVEAMGRADIITVLKDKGVLA